MGTSEIVKPASSKMEALGRVKDRTTGNIEDGDWTTNMIAISPETKHPIPVLICIRLLRPGLSVKMKKRIKAFAMWIICSARRRLPLSMAAVYLFWERNIGMNSVDARLQNFLWCFVFDR